MISGMKWAAVGDEMGFSCGCDGMKWAAVLGEMEWLLSGMKWAVSGNQWADIAR